MRICKVVVLICSVLLFLIVAGCGRGADIPEFAKNQDFTIESGEERAGVFFSEPDVVQYPLDTSCTELSISYPYITELGRKEDMIFSKQASDEVGVLIKLVPVPSEQYQGTLTASIAAANICDVYVSVPEYYLTSDFDVFLELSDLIKEYAPNYISAVNRTLDGPAAVTSDDGGVWSMYQFYDAPQLFSQFGAVIRQDWLDKTGIEKLETYEDYHDYLVACNNKFAPDQTVRMFQRGVTDYDNLTAGFDISLGSKTPAGGFYQVNGEIKYGVLEEGFSEYLQMIHQWFNEGLITLKFLDSADPFTNSYLTDLSVNPSALCFVPLNSYSTLEELCDFPIAPAQDPVRVNGDVSHIASKCASNIRSSGFSVSSFTDYPEVAVQVIDWCYSEEATRWANSEIDGDRVAIEREDSADLSIMDKGSEGVPLLNLLGIGDVRRFCIYQSAFSPVLNVWNKQKDGAYMLPPSLSFTQEETEEYSTLMTDISTYVDSVIPQFIIGELPLEDISKVQKRVEELGIKRCIEIWEIAFTRYCDRAGD